MNGYYKLIHFVADHFSGAQFPIGAVVTENGSIRVAIADRIPGAECLGSDATYALLRDTLDRLRVLTNFDRLPMSIGPHFVLTDPNPLPKLTTDPVDWLKATILPRQMQTPSKATQRSPNRSKLGLNYLTQFGVAHYLKPFRPSTHLHELNGATATLPSISQGVRGDGQLLLMEPIAPLRPQLRDDIKTIGTNFFAYRGALQKHPIPIEVGLVAYILPGAEPKTRQQIIDRLSESADRIYDAASMPERQELIGRVSEIGRSGQLDNFV
jgi:hypothetical protein